MVRVEFAVALVNEPMLPTKPVVTLNAPSAAGVPATPLVIAPVKVPPVALTIPVLVMAPFQVPALFSVPELASVLETVPRALTVMLAPALLVIPLVVDRLPFVASPTVTKPLLVSPPVIA